MSDVLDLLKEIGIEIESETVKTLMKNLSKPILEDELYQEGFVDGWNKELRNPKEYNTMDHSLYFNGRDAGKAFRRQENLNLNKSS
tara:strand:+ start:356 stop:613 length:258 start_codon:yes stop_codon:yes gene_type:complete